MFIDSHSHMFDEKINIEKADLTLVDAIIVPSYNMENLSKVIDFCSKYKKCYCALGVHPNWADEYDNEKFLNIVLENKSKIYAIGEIGLDSLSNVDYLKQIDVFKNQLEIAEKLNLPITVHLRTKKDFDNFFNIFNSYNIKCAIHCFNSDLKDCKKAIKLGCYISFATNITYKRNVDLRKIALCVPFPNLLIETDAPSMLPASFKRRGINSSENVFYTAETLAKIKNCEISHIAKITFENANKLFNLGLEYNE